MKVFTPCAGIIIFWLYRAKDSCQSWRQVMCTWPGNKYYNWQMTSPSLKFLSWSQAIFRCLPNADADADLIRIRMQLPFGQGWRRAAGETLKSFVLIKGNLRAWHLICSVSVCSRCASGKGLVRGWQALIKNINIIEILNCNCRKRLLLLMRAFFGCRAWQQLGLRTVSTSSFFSHLAVLRN